MYIYMYIYIYVCRHIKVCLFLLYNFIEEKHKYITDKSILIQGCFGFIKVWIIADI